MHTRKGIEYAIEYAFSDIFEVKRALSVMRKGRLFCICLTHLAFPSHHPFVLKGRLVGQPQSPEVGVTFMQLAANYLAQDFLKNIASDV